MLHFDFSNQHILINGGNTGIGRAIVLAFAEAKANVSFVYYGGESASADASATKKDAESFGVSVHEKMVDSSDWDAIHSFIEEAIQLRGKIDALVNVAGITRDAMLWKMTKDDWKNVMDVNVGSYFNCIHAVAPHFRSHKHGRIVNITSINGMRGKAGQANYAASKAAVIALTKTAAKEFGSSNVTVNAVAPGFISTAMTELLPEEIKQRAIKETVLGRAGSVEDVANAVLFLASAEARHISGVVLKVDGGQYI